MGEMDGELEFGLQELQ